MGEHRQELVLPAAGFLHLLKQPRVIDRGRRSPGEILGQYQVVGPVAAIGGVGAEADGADGMTPSAQRRHHVGTQPQGPQEAYWPSSREERRSQASSVSGMTSPCPVRRA